MSLEKGSRLGPYTIVSPLGAGGMGEVYRARDARLGRDVAIKVLPPAYSADRDRLRRFEQEARSAGQLNHPNVLAIYDVGTHEGSPYVVAELLDGETLRDVVAGGALPLRKAIDYAHQIAEGLAAAHERGIVHRDLKPENLFLTRDGRVKILDFGLAKLTHPDFASEPGTGAVTAGPSETESGVLMGTVGYMSPEQLRGKQVDYRSDIFAFGAILYELLSGKRAFHGDSVPETMNAILKDDPPELAASNPRVSPGLERVVRRCLEKKPEARFQSTRDLAFALEALSAPSGVVGPAQVPAPAPRVRRRTLTFAAALAVLAAGAGLYLAGRRNASPPVPKFQRLTFRRGAAVSARFAPDGQTVVYGAAWEGEPIRLFSTRLGSPESTVLALPPADILAISSSGELAISLCGPREGLFFEAGTLARVPLAGGAPRELLQQVLAADWAPDGKELAVLRKVGERTRLEFPSGTKLHEGQLRGVRFSPDGGRIAFFEETSTPLVSSVTVIELRNNKKLKLGDFPNALSLAWSPEGNEILFMSSEEGEGGHFALYAVSLSGKSRVVARFPVAFDFIDDVSRDGRVLMTIGTYRGSMTALLPGQTQEKDLSWFNDSVTVGMSSDGTKALFNEQSMKAIYMRKTDGSPAVRLAGGWAYSISPDGNWVLASPWGQFSKYILIPTGPGESKTLELSGVELELDPKIHWFPDNKRFLADGRQSGRPIRTFMLDIAGTQPRPVTPEGVRGGPISADGRFLLCRNSTPKAMICSTEGDLPRPLPGPPEPGDFGLWNADGRSFFVGEKEGLVGRIFRRDLATGRRDLVRQFTPSDPAGICGWNFEIGPEGKSYSSYVLRCVTDLYLVEGLR